MSTTILRNYQNKLIEDVHASWAQGNQAVIMQLATGGGKTVTFVEIVAQHPKPVLIIAHRAEIIYQISLALARRGLRHFYVAPLPTVREGVALHMRELQQSFYSTTAHIAVASVDTLKQLSFEPDLIVVDEGHHVLRKNKWGKILAKWPNARLLLVTATPTRSDGMGLGYHTDGLAHSLVQSLSMRDLIAQGHLCNYRIFAPKSDLNLIDVPIAASGEYSHPKLCMAVGKSHLVGDVVEHYRRLANRKLGITFCVSIQAATETLAAFREAGIAAEILTGQTPQQLRAHILSKFRAREILQLINVDILGEGVDVPAVEVISFARPTNSFGLYCQQFGRGLRPLLGKDRVIIIDHVGNTLRHGLPDAHRVWTLDRKEKRSKSSEEPLIKIKTCIECFLVYSREYNKCPHCGHKSLPIQRTLDHVDGDLCELDLDMLAKMRGEVKRIDSPPRIPIGLPKPAQYAVVKNHEARQKAQCDLRSSIALYAGLLKSQGLDDSRIYRKFYLTFGIDILSAQVLNTHHAEILRNTIDAQFNKCILT